MRVPQVTLLRNMEEKKDQEDYTTCGIPSLSFPPYSIPGQPRVLFISALFHTFYWSFLCHFNFYGKINFKFHSFFVCFRHGMLPSKDWQHSKQHQSGKAYFLINCYQGIVVIVLGAPYFSQNTYSHFVETCCHLIKTYCHLIETYLPSHTNLVCQLLKTYFHRLYMQQ